MTDALSNSILYRCDGERQLAGDCNVYFYQSAYRQVVEHLSRDKTREHGGLLLGYELCSHENETPAVLVTEALPAEHTLGTHSSLTFTEETWRNFDERTEKHRGLLRVGWYHSHPNIHLFLSRWDLDVCTTFDRRQHAIALVVDPVNDEGAFFVRGRAGYRPQSPQGFYEFRNLQADSIVTWKNISLVERPQSTNKGYTEPLLARSPSTEPVRRNSPLRIRRPQSQPQPPEPKKTSEKPGGYFSRIYQSLSLFSPLTIVIFMLVVGAFGFLIMRDFVLSRRLEEVNARLQAVQQKLDAMTKNLTGNATATVTLRPAATAVSVSVTPATQTLEASKTIQFKAKVSGGANQEVNWSMIPSNLGNISATGLYTAPASISAQQTVTIKATSKANQAKFGTAAVTLKPSTTPPVAVSVAVSPSNATLEPSQKQKFAANIRGSSNRSVKWSRNPEIGTISQSGEYTAPDSISAEQQVTVTATSETDASKSGIATVTLQPPAPAVVSVTVSPSDVALLPKGTAKFDAKVGGGPNKNVVWSIDPPGTGKVTSDGTYTAPDLIASEQTVTIRAVSDADSSKSGTAKVTLKPGGDSATPSQPPRPNGDGS